MAALHNAYMEGLVVAERIASVIVNAISVLALLVIALIVAAIASYAVQYLIGLWSTYPPCDPGLGPVRVPDLSGFRAIRPNRV